MVATLISALLGAFGQIELKRGANLLEWDVVNIISNYHLIAGLAIYAISTVFYIYALKSGSDLSLLYPIIATSYIWVLLLSKIFFNENIQAINWFGCLVLILGITLVLWR